MTFNIYVPSYKRFGQIIAQKNLEYCTYVVRKSEEQAYIDAGVKSVLAVPDEEINSLSKVFVWIYKNTPEEVICVCDDDVSDFYYRIDTLEHLSDTSTITTEIERLAQIMVDTNIGFLTLPSDMNVKYYDRPFKFVGVPGSIRIYNKRKFKAVDNGKFKYFTDIDIVLQELMYNRIVYIPNYFVHKAAIDTNGGGNNESKTIDEMNAEKEVMKNKWGRHFFKGDGQKMWRIDVQR